MSQGPGAGHRAESRATQKEAGHDRSHWHSQTRVDKHAIEPLVVAVRQSPDVLAIEGPDIVAVVRAEFRNLGIADNTIVWFVSDNGGVAAASNDPSKKGKFTIGCRVPGLLEWPARIKQHVKTDVVAGHIDMYPTLLEIAGVKVEKQPVVDGISLVPLIDGKMTERPKPIGFMLWQGKDSSDFKAGGAAFLKADFIKDSQGVWIDGKYKLIVSWENPKGSSAPLLYDIYADPAHKTNLADQEPERVQKMRQALDEWRKSVEADFRFVTPKPAGVK